MKRTSRHHVIPISIGGWDCEENIIFLTHDEHTELHKKLNMTYDSIRVYRKRTNHIIFINEYVVREMSLVQHAFFKNIGSLQAPIVEMIATSLERQVDKLIHDNHVEHFNVNRTFENSYHKARYMLKSYHSLYLIIVLRKNKQ